MKGWEGFRTATVTFLWVVTAACAEAPDLPGLAGAGDGTVVRTDSAGVEIVTNRAAESTLAWSVEPRLEIEAEFVTLNPDRSLGADSSGNVYVMDVGDRTVHVFDPDGRPLRSLGRQGEGPGELRSATFLLVRPDGEVAVYDAGKRAFVRFGSDGEILDERPVSPAVAGRAALGAARPSMMTPLPEGFLTVLGGGPMSGRRVSLLRTSADDTSGGWAEPEEIVTWELPASVDPDAACQLPAGARPIFTFEPSVASRDGRIGYSVSPEYRIDVVDGAGVVRSIRRDLSPEPATLELASREVGPFALPEFIAASLGECELTAERHAEALGWQDVIPWILDLSLAPDGTWYVLRRDPGSEPAERIDVFAADGAYLGTLPSDAPWPGAWRTSEEFLRVERDELDRARVVVYRVGRGGGPGA